MGRLERAQRVFRRLSTRRSNAFAPRWVTSMGAAKQRQVAFAIQKAQRLLSLASKARIMFAALQFDPEVPKDLDYYNTKARPERQG